MSSISFHMSEATGEEENGKASKNITILSGNVLRKLIEDCCMKTERKRGCRIIMYFLVIFPSLPSVSAQKICFLSLAFQPPTLQPLQRNHMELTFCVRLLRNKIREKLFLDNFIFSFFFLSLFFQLSIL